MLREWHDTVEKQINSELDEPPETNIQLASDILYAYEYEPQVIVQLVQDMISTANQSVMWHVDKFLSDMQGLGTGLELANVNIDNYGTVKIEFNVVSDNIINIWQDDPSRKEGGLYALI